MRFLTCKQFIETLLEERNNEGNQSDFVGRCLDKLKQGYSNTDSVKKELNVLYQCDQDIASRLHYDFALWKEQYPYLSEIFLSQGVVGCISAEEDAGIGSLKCMFMRKMLLRLVTDAEVEKMHKELPRFKESCMILAKGINRKYDIVNPIDSLIKWTALGWEKRKVDESWIKKIVHIDGNGEEIYPAVFIMSHCIYTDPVSHETSTFERNVSSKSTLSRDGWDTICTKKTIHYVTEGNYG